MNADGEHTIFVIRRREHGGVWQSAKKCNSLFDDRKECERLTGIAGTFDQQLALKVLRDVQKYNPNSEFKVFAVAFSQLSSPAH